MKRFKFLKGLDNYLLRNHPGIWSIQLHKFMPWFAIGLLLASILIYIQNPEGYSYKDEEIYLSWLYVIATGGLIIWLVYMFRFNPIKSFGKRPVADEYKNFILTFIGIALLASAPFIFRVMRNARVCAKVSDEQVVNTVNKLNLGFAINKSFYFDTIVIHDRDSSRRLAFSQGHVNNQQHYRVTSEAIAAPAVPQFDSHGFRQYLETFDSTYYSKEDSSWYCFKFHHYKKLGLQHRSSEDEPELLSGKQIMYAMKALKSREDSVRIIKDFVQAANVFYPFKYNVPYLLNKLDESKFPNIQLENYVRTMEEDTYESEMRAMENVVDENVKYWSIYDDDDWSDIFHGLFYLVFYVTLFILIFRNMALKTYLISIGVGIVLPLVVVLIALGLGANEASHFFGTATFCYVLTWAVYLSFRNSSRRSMIPGIALNLLTVTTPLLGVFFANWWVYEYTRFRISQETNYELIAMVQFWGEVGGIVLFFVLLQPLFKRAYVHWFSMPKE